MQDQPVPRSPKDQTAAQHRNQVSKDLVAAALTGLLASQTGKLDPQQIAKDAVATARATLAEMMLKGML